MRLSVRCSGSILPQFGDPRGAAVQLSVEWCASHLCLVAEQRVHVGAIVQAPQLDCAVERAAEQLVSALPARTQSDEPNIERSSWERARERKCVCVSVSVREKECVCVCEREREIVCVRVYVR